MILDSAAARAELWPYIHHHAQGCAARDAIVFYCEYCDLKFLW